MKKQLSSIEIGEEKINYILRPHKRAKYFKLTIYADRGLVVTVPKRGYSNNLLQSFLLKNGSWIAKKILDYSILKKKFGWVDREKEYREKKEEARLLVKKKIEEYISIYNFPVGKIFIKNQRTRWGSCSGRGNLNFNYRILFLPERLANYVIFHELCHLKEFNHSSHFWALVVKEFPDYLSLREELKKHRLSIF